MIHYKAEDIRNAFQKVNEQFLLSSASFDALGLRLDAARRTLEQMYMLCSHDTAPIEEPPDDTALSWDEWNAKVDRLLRECGEE